MANLDGSCHFFLADSQSKSVGLVWGLAATSALSLHLSNELGELSQWLCHDDGIINIILVIIIIIIIIIYNLEKGQIRGSKAKPMVGVRSKAPRKTLVLAVPQTLNSFFYLTDNVSTNFSDI